jgi:flagellar assembly protein FliH
MSSPFSENILYGAKIKGVVFCPATDEHSQFEKRIKEKTIENDEEAILLAEKAGYKKGFLEGQKQGFELGQVEGVQIGFKSGFETAERQLKDTVALLNLMASSVQIKREELFEQIKPDIIKCCLLLTTKLLQQELLNPKIFISLLEQLLEQLKSTVKDVPIDLHLSPEDLKMLKNSFENLDLEKNVLSKINLISDSNIEKGSCRFETSRGVLNYHISRIINDLEIKLLEA